MRPLTIFSALVTLLFVSVTVSAESLAEKQLYIGRNNGVLETLNSDLANQKGLKFVSLPVEENHIGLLISETLKTNPQVMLFLYGNGASLNLLMKSGVFERFKKARVIGAALEYPGYGTSNGTTSEKAFVKAVGVGLDYLNNTYSKKPVLIGHSLGGAVATQSAYAYPQLIQSLIVISSFIDFESMVKEVVSPWLVPLAMFGGQDKYNNGEAMKSITLPTLIIHGTQDKVIQYANGEKLSTARAQNPGSDFFPISEMGHNDVYAQPGANVYADTLWGKIAALFLK